MFAISTVICVFQRLLCYRKIFQQQQQQQQPFIYPQKLQVQIRL